MNVLNTAFNLSVHELHNNMTFCSDQDQFNQLDRFIGHTELHLMQSNTTDAAINAVHIELFSRPRYRDDSALYAQCGGCTFWCC